MKTTKRSSKSSFESNSSEKPGENGARWRSSIKWYKNEREVPVQRKEKKKAPETPPKKHKAEKKSSKKVSKQPKRKSSKKVSKQKPKKSPKKKGTQQHGRRKG